MVGPEFSAAWTALTMLIAVLTAEGVSQFSLHKNIFEPKIFQGKYCCLNGSNSPNCDGPTVPTRTTPATVKTTKFKGPLYLPQPTVKTTRVPYVPQTYTWGSPATYTYSYKWSHGPWSHGPTRSTVTYTTSTTPKYAYNGPSNHGLSYAGEDDNSV